MLRAWAIEGTGGHGAGLSRHLLESSEIVIELDLNRPWSKERFNPLTWERPMANFRVSEAVARALWLRRTKPIAEVTDMLRKAHAHLRDSVGGFAYTHGDVDFLSLNVSDLAKGWQDASDDAQLVTTQQQLFRPLGGSELELVANPMAASG